LIIIKLIVWKEAEINGLMPSNCAVVAGDATASLSIKFWGKIG